MMHTHTCCNIQEFSRGMSQIHGKLVIPDWFFVFCCRLTVEPLLATAATCIVSWLLLVGGRCVLLLRPRCRYACCKRSHFLRRHLPACSPLDDQDKPLPYDRLHSAIEYHPSLPWFLFTRSLLIACRRHDGFSSPRAFDRFLCEKSVSAPSAPS